MLEFAYKKENVSKYKEKINIRGVTFTHGQRQQKVQVLFVSKVERNENQSF